MTAKPLPAVLFPPRSPMPSIEAGDLILRPNRLRYLLLALVSAGCTAAGVLIVRSGGLWGWAEIAFFGACTAVFCVMLFPNAVYLKLEPAGFTFRSLFRSHAMHWYEVDAFATARIGNRNLVVFNFSPFHRGQKHLRKIASAIAGYEAALPDTYGLGAEELAALMNQWRQRACSRDIQPG